MLALEPTVVDALAVFCRLPARTGETPTHWAVIALGSRTATASRPSCSGWSPGAPGTWPAGSAKEARRPCVAAATSG